jgi:hypothetical protein
MTLTFHIVSDYFFSVHTYGVATKQRRKKYLPPSGTFLIVQTVSQVIVLVYVSKNKGDTAIGTKQP